MDVRIKQIIDWTIPYFGNDNTMPYGTLLITDGETEKFCKTKGTKYYENGTRYITFKRKRYKVVNNGGLHSPKLSLMEY